MNSVEEQKTDLRKWIANKKKEFSLSVLEERSDILLQIIELLPEFVNAKTVFLYYSMPDEVATHAFVKKWSNTKCIYLPVIEADEMKLREYSPNEGLITGSFNIKEPQGALCKDFEVIDFAMVPGVAFDRHGFRMGRGKAYYDRVLPLLVCSKVGVCFDFQLMDKVPLDEWDVPMDFVVTELGLITPKSRNHST